MGESIRNYFKPWHYALFVTSFVIGILMGCYIFWPEHKYGANGPVRNYSGGCRYDLVRGKMMHRYDCPNHIKQ